MSYMKIIATVLRIPTAAGRQKAFSTCAAHITVVSVTYGSCISMYILPKQEDGQNINKVVAILNNVELTLPSVDPEKKTKILTLWIKLGGLEMLRDEIQPPPTAWYSQPIDLAEGTSASPGLGYPGLIQTPVVHPQLPPAFFQRSSSPFQGAHPPPPGRCLLPLTCFPSARASPGQRGLVKCHCDSGGCRQGDVGSPDLVFNQASFRSLSLIKRHPLPSFSA
ncbi:hypothetical protein lerEdw1_011600 [Lerista edwardsae]|nr:hypothetical protein lerEdw1_011600 [Lerista edwardsae]